MRSHTMRRQCEEQARKRCFVAAVLLGAAFVTLEADGQTAGQTRLSVSYGNLPLSFEANEGQSDERVKFLARGQGYGLFLTPTEAVLSLRAPAQHKRSAAERAAPERAPNPMSRRNPSRWCACGSWARTSIRRSRDSIRCLAGATTSSATTPRDGSATCRTTPG